MNKSTWNTKLLSSLLLALVLSACKSTPMNTKPVAVEDKSAGPIPNTLVQGECCSPSAGFDPGVQQSGLV